VSRHERGKWPEDRSATIITGKLGVAFDRVLLYGKAGVAFAHDTDTITDPFGNTATIDQLRIG